MEVGANRNLARTMLRASGASNTYWPLAIRRASEARFSTSDGTGNGNTSSVTFWSGSYGSEEALASHIYMGVSEHSSSFVGSSK